MSLSKLLGKKLTAIGSALVVLSALVGFWLDPKGFAVNILAGVVGVFISFVLGIGILNRYIEAKREQQWAKVRDLTYMSISNHLYDIAQQAGINCGLAFPHARNTNFPALSEGRDHPNPVVAQAMSDLCSKMEALPGAKGTDNKLSDIAVEFYRDVLWNLDQISNVLLPRVVQSTNELEVVDSLIEFDRARLNLHNAAYVHKLIVIGGIFPDMINLVRSAQVLYRTLAKAA
jgi:hypothetical protein